MAEKFAIIKESRMVNDSATLAVADLISCNNEGPHGVAEVYRPRHTETASELVGAFCVSGDYLDFLVEFGETLNG
jgi:hypothetical protein